MKLLRLEIRSMPGISQPGISIENFSDTISIIEGPNGSGKTSSCNALRGLLWPGLLPRNQWYDLSAQWSNNDQTLTSTRNGLESAWQNQDGSGQAPNLPDQHLANCFLITIEDLFDDSAATDLDIARRVKTALAGGFDLDSLRQSKLLNASSRKAIDASKVLADTRRHVQSIRSSHQNLRREEVELQQLSRVLEQSEAIETESLAVAQAQAFAVLQRESAGLKAQLGEFPPWFSSLTGEEDSQAKALEQRISTLESGIATVKKRSEQNQQAIITARIPATGFNNATLLEADCDLKLLSDAEEAVSTLTRQLAGERYELEQIDSQLRVQTSDKQHLSGDFPAVNREQLEKIERLHGEHQLCDAELSALDAELALLESQTESLIARELPQDGLAIAVKLLRHWLRQTNYQQSRMLVNALLASCLFTSSIIILAAWYLNPLLVILLLFPIAALLIASRHGLLALEDLNSAGQVTYCRLGLEQPLEWTPAAVELLLGQLERELESATRAELIYQRITLLRSEQSKSNTKKLQRLAELNKLCAAIGLAPDCSRLALVIFANALCQRSNAQARLSRLSAELNQAKLQAKARLEKLQQLALLTNRQQPQAQAQAVALVAELKTALNNLTYATSQIESDDQLFAEYHSELAELQTQLRELFEKAELAVGEIAALKLALSRLSDYRQIADEIRGRELQQLRIRSELSNFSALLSLTEQQLEIQASKLKQKQLDYREAIERTSAIKRALSDARADQRLAAAYQDEFAAKEVLSDQLSASILQDTARDWLDEIELDYQHKSQPQVFIQAQKMFSQFTQGRYKLLSPNFTTDREIEFLALDSLHRQTKTLDQLSRGTRMQLLLAARFSFALLASSAETLPIILDEALSQSDPERFTAIAQALAELSANGLQIVYFSCRPEDSARLMEIAQSRGLDNAVVIRLEPPSVAGENPKTLALPTLSRINRRIVPAPGSYSKDEYLALLGVEPIDFNEQAANLHLGHLIDEPQLLYEFLQAGIERYGQFNQLKTYQALGSFASQQQIAQIVAKAEVCQGFIEAYLVGRGKRLTPEIIFESPASATFRPRIQQLAQELDWDSRRLLESINPDQGKSLKRFGRESYLQLEQHFRDRGYFDSSAPLDKEQSRARVFACAQTPLQQQVISTGEVNSLFEALWKSYQLE